MKEINNRIGDWQETYTGIFYTLDPRVEEVHLEDIAHGLSQICRFTGQCKHFYSVAQHCLNVYRNLKDKGYDEKIQLIGLLHDASEVYICDLPKPFKVELPNYKVIEEKIERVIYEKFVLEFPNEEIHKIIKAADNEILYNEVENLMNNIGHWTEKYPHRKLNIDTKFRDMTEVEQEYLETVNQLLLKK